MTIDEALRCLAEDRRNERAWLAVYRYYWPYAVAIAYRRLHHQREQASEAAQETFVRLLRYAAFDRPWTEEGFKRYLAAICAHVCTDMETEGARRASRERPLETATAGEGTGGVAESDEAHFVAEDEYRAILEGFGEQDRGILELVVNGHSFAEIADAMGMTYAAVAMRVSRLRERFRRLRDG
ncbi:MAG TPA: sigma-70 family RNA polymerase sigma factor [Candidatus Kapabacteria bacterium]|nr:sigma-70 family RNA polymerase sigma factor [Candidatus Kapabacteria bacterium]